MTIYRTHNRGENKIGVHWLHIIENLRDSIKFLAYKVIMQNLKRCSIVWFFLLLWGSLSELIGICAWETTAWLLVELVFILFPILTTNAVSHRQVLQKALEPPILFWKVASSLCPTDFVLYLSPSCPHAPCAQQYLSVLCL